MAPEWIGPFKISELLQGCAEPGFPMPPESGSAYLITLKSWEGKPSHEAVPLYGGGNTGQSKRFRTRIGDLIADIFGFFTDERHHHSGGRSIRDWTISNKVHPLDLYIAWVVPGGCHRCLEVQLVGDLAPLLNKRPPPGCERHAPADR